MEARLHPEYTLELLTEDDNTSYIAFKSTGAVSSSLEQDEETAVINFEVDNLSRDGLQQYLYKLTTDPEIEAIEVFVDGELTPFDNVTQY